MKSFISVVLLVCIVPLSVSGQTDSLGLSGHAVFSKKMADRTAVQLKLDKSQRAQVLAINQHLSDMKMRVRKESSDRATVGKRLQQIEGMRDSLYKSVFKKEQFETYKKTKASLINNNGDKGPVLPVKH